MNAIIIGLGPHGKRVLKAIQAIEEIQLYAIVDLSETVLSTIETDESVLKSTSLDSLLQQNTSIDIACITTNGPSHAKLAIQCMEAGIQHVMVEKPMACSIEECQNMIQVASATKTKLVVDHPRRYSHNYGYIQRNIQTGRWGQVRSVYIQRPGIGLGCLGTHSFDLATFLINKPVKNVTAWIDAPLKKNPRGEHFIDPGGTVILDYGEGTKGIITQIEDGAGPISIEINLTAARIRLDEKMNVLEVIERDLSVKKAPGKGAAYQQLINPDNIGGKRVLVDEIKRLLLDLIQNEAPKSSAQHGYESIEILVAAYVSQENGNIPVALPLEQKYHTKWLPVT